MFDPRRTGHFVARGQEVARGQVDSASNGPWVQLPRTRVSNRTAPEVCHPFQAQRARLGVAIQHMRQKLGTRNDFAMLFERIRMVMKNSTDRA